MTSLILSQEWPDGLVPGLVQVSGVRKSWTEQVYIDWYNLRKYSTIGYISNAGGPDGIIFSVFFSMQPFFN
jgi:hypothetical protein